MQKTIKNILYSKVYGPLIFVLFFDKVFGVLAQQSDFSSIIAVWFPNFVFGSLAIYLLYINANKQL